MPTSEKEVTYAWKVIHAESKFGVESHFGNTDHLIKFLDGTYANLMPGDTVLVFESWDALCKYEQGQ